MCNQNETSGIANCPFCRKEGPVLLLKAEEYHVACPRCGARGPVCESPSRAEAMWNRAGRAAEVFEVLEVVQ